MKKVLIISPHFPPVNAPDMHRVRQSLPYFKELGWEPTILCVSPEFVEMNIDHHLKKTIPSDIDIHTVAGFSTRYTRKFGLGNLGIRSFWQMYKKGNELLRQNKFDLIYFSTTVFSCMPLGRIWKQKFGMPFVLDFQDPWQNDYYLTVPKNERPPKFWFAHRLNKFLEAYTLPKVDGLISVSKGYLDTFKIRYPDLDVPMKVLTFGAAENDFKVLDTLALKPFFNNGSEQINIVYVGVGGHIMHPSLSILFRSFKEGLLHNNDFEKCRFWFIGTSYAPTGQGKKTIIPLATEIGIESYVEEVTDRVSYFDAMSIVQQSDVILIIGSNDSNYTASKLYPYILAKKPILCIFHSNSSVGAIIKKLNAGDLIFLDKADAEKNCQLILTKILKKLPYKPDVKWDKFLTYTARFRTFEQVEFFNLITFKNK